ARSTAHDLKNPRTSIGISAELAAMDNATLEVRRAAKDRIRKQIDRLSDMINELLEFTRGSTAAVVLAKSNYAEFVRQLLEEIRPEVAAKSVAVEMEYEPPAVGLLMNPKPLSTVF